MESNLCLIGMPGAGKSTLGVILAKILTYDFLDTDLLLQKSAQKSLAEILAAKGNDGFLEMENRLVSSLTASHTVIATGGSVIYGKEAMAHLHTLGTVIYLEVPFPEISRRIADFHARGVAMGKAADLSALYAERHPLYLAQADLVIPVAAGMRAEQTVASILTALQKQKDPLQTHHPLSAN